MPGPMSWCVQVFELQPSYASDVAGAAATLVGNLADVHEALAAPRSARSRRRTPPWKRA